MSYPIIVLYEASVLGKGRHYNTARTGIYHYIQNLACALSSSHDVKLLPICLDRESLHETLCECKDAGLDISLLRLQLSSSVLLLSRLHRILSELSLIIFKSNRVPRQISKPFSYLVHGVRNKAEVLFSRSTARALDRFKSDKNKLVIHETYRTHSSNCASHVYSRAKARCITIYDLIPLLYPHFFDPGIPEAFSRFISTLNPSDRIIAISQTTKRDLSHFSSIKSDNISVTPLSINPEFRLLSQHEYEPSALELMEKHSLLDSRFILSIATLEPRKNISSLISSFATVVDRLQHGTKLVLVGESGWGNQNLRKIVDDHGITARVIFTGYLQDKFLPALLNKASLFCYLSLYEGFGMPVLEAMSCGCPVITSTTSSLGEFFGDVACCVDPLDHASISDSIFKVLTDQTYSDKLRSEGLRYAKRFTASNLSSLTIQAYRTALSSHK